MAAAVSDYRPSEKAPQKLKKAAEATTVLLEPNPDILAALGEIKPPTQVLVGFAAETENLLENAKDKLVRKNLDFIVANDLSKKGSGFGCDTNEVKIIERKRRRYRPASHDKGAGRLGDMGQGRAAPWRCWKLIQDKTDHELADCLERLRWIFGVIRPEVSGTGHTRLKHPGKKSQPAAACQTGGTELVADKQ